VAAEGKLRNRNDRLSSHASAAAKSEFRDE